MLLAIYGSGGLGREILQLVKDINSNFIQYNELVFINDDKTEKDIKVDGIVVTTFDKTISKYNKNEVKFIIGIGEPVVRKKKYDLIKKNGYYLATLIHPSLSLSKTIFIDEGTIINKYTFISTNVRIGKNSYIQPFAAIGHDVVIGDNCVISSHTTIGGHCSIENNSFIAMNVPIREGINIGEDCIIGMGSIITKNVPNNTITAGAIGREIQKPNNKLVFK